MQSYQATDIESLFQNPFKSEPEKTSKTPPYNLEAELALLGAIILSNSTYEHISDFLRAEHFSQPIHCLIFRAITNLLERGHIADPISLQDILNTDPTFIELGGYQYLLDLTDACNTFISVAHHGRIIFDLYIRRQLIDIGHETIADACLIDGERASNNVIEDAERRLYNLATFGNSGTEPILFGDALAKAITTAESAFKRDGNIVGVTTGFTALDKCLGGLHASDLLILAGRPSMGKTALATNIAFNAAKSFINDDKNGAPVLFFSLEMSSEQLANRILSSESGVSSDLIRRGAIIEYDFPKFAGVTREFGKMRLFIDETPALTVTAVRNRARRLQRQHGIGLIVIDYLQLLSGNGTTKDGNRVQEISEITRSLKALAKELNVPVLALSQLSRAVEQRDDKRPQLSDLRESGSIEQDSDVVMFVYREEYYESRKEPTPGSDKYVEWQANMARVNNKAEIIIAKQRHGPIGTVRLSFDGSVTKFGDLDHEYQ